VLKQNALNRIIQGRTTFVVAHRLTTIRDASRIVVMSQGQIAEVGPHDELMALGGIYSKMVMLQSPGNAKRGNAGSSAT